MSNNRRAKQPTPRYLCGCAGVPDARSTATWAVYVATCPTHGQRLDPSTLIPE